ncbi:ABC transporter ATP-binding protein [Clostridiales bacterium AHG0011]|uniref:ABC transporter ATP-binding protein n=1 Tax=Enterocloster aldenensis TaxID=358742 RepID=UPI000ED750E1|nr:ABC transporter ATP-binding protein [Clostridium sp.]MCC3398392.1 ABC transporter ATP-binding protein [Clostridiales bacterium AHG0011]RGC58289.1 ABC transporter ATP-binding protein [Dorea longicatena]
MNDRKMGDKVNRHYARTARRLMGYVASTYKLQFACVLVAIIISALANVAGPLFLMVLIDDFITPLMGQQGPDFTALNQAMAGLAAFYVAGVICTYIYNRLMVNIGQGVQKRVRDEMFEHMQTLPIRYFDQHPHGELMSRYTNDIDTLRQMINQALPMAFSSLITILAISAVMISISIPLSVLAAAMVLLMLFISRTLAGRCGKYFVAQQLAIGRVTGYIEERLGGQKVIKVFNHEAETMEEFDALNNKLRQSAFNANKYANVIMPVITNIGNLQFVLTAITGGLLSLCGLASLTLGQIASYLQFTKSFNQPFAQISQQSNSIIMALAGAERIFNMMDEEPEPDEGSVTLVNARVDGKGTITEAAERTNTWAWKYPNSDGTYTYTKLCGDVRFADMDFGYDPRHMVLHNISLYAKPGQKLAFVGATGAGKTTITNLINRFYDIQKGSITYDGIDIGGIRKEDLRRSLGIVLQDTHLFTGTIMENIRYGRLDATDEEVYGAARLANADQFIRMLPQGYGTMLTGDGEELSQGQRQLLAIARAAIADPPVLILDEATSSIDTRTEALVQGGMDELMKGRTVFVIAHRLSTIRNSDAIMVLDHGNIVERGNHESLIKEKGIYYQLYTGGLELD